MMMMMMMMMMMSSSFFLLHCTFCTFFIFTSIELFLHSITIIRTETH